MAAHRSPQQITYKKLDGCMCEVVSGMFSLGEWRGMFSLGGWVAGDGLAGKDHSSKLW